MDPVKRRLIYVADEQETLLSELSGTPPTRPSRHTRLLVPPSPLPSSPRSSGPLSPPPHPVVSAVPDVPAVVDRQLLVSYDGHLLADGSGGFAPPRNAVEAAALRDALKVCRTYLLSFVGQQSDGEAASVSTYSASASSSTYVEEEEEEASDGDSSSDDLRPSPKRRRRVRAAAHRPSLMTVAELKALLRDRGEPTTGNKASLITRAQAALAKASAAPQPVGGTDVAAAPSSSPSEMRMSSEVTVRFSRGTASSGTASPASSLLASPASRTSTEGNGLWGAFVTASTRLFHRTARHSFGGLAPAATAEDRSPPAKRRRSA